MRLTLLEITSFLFYFFFVSDFHELWRSVMSACLLTEVKQQWAMLVLGWVTDGFAACASRLKTLFFVQKFKIKQKEQLKFICLAESKY